MHFNGGGQSQVLLEKNVFNKGGYFLLTPPKCSNFEDIKFAPFYKQKKRVPQNAAISKISNLHLFTSKEKSPPKCSNFEVIKFAPFY